MLSLKNFLNVSEDELALRNIISLLLEKIGTAAVASEGAEHSAFCTGVDELRVRADNEVSPALLSLTVASIVKAMEVYNLHITELLQRYSTQLECILSMVAETALNIGGENMRSAERLQEIGNSFHVAGSLPDIDALKASLGDCLRSFREEVERHKTESNAVVTTLQQGIEHSKTHAGNMEDCDPVTGLQQRSTALTVMQTAADGGEQLYVAAIVVRGVQSVNIRFGREVGDRMLSVFKEHIEKKLSAKDRLFRWDGPALVALLSRQEPIGQVRVQFRRMLETRIEETFDVDGRTVLIPIAADSLTFSLVAPVAAAVKQIQSFVGGKAGAK